MLSVQNCSLSPSRVSFKSNEKQNPYANESAQVNKTHAGLKTGVVYSGLGALSTCFIDKLVTTGQKVLNKDFAEELGKEGLKELNDNIKQFRGNKWISLAMTVVAGLGCGALVDKAINNKRAKLAERLATEDKKDILLTEKRADTTRAGEVYYKSNQGKKLGTLLGAVCLPVMGQISKHLLKLPGIGIVGGALMGALGGFVLGAITDGCANKNERKHADKQALETLNA